MANMGSRHEFFQRLCRAGRGETSAGLEFQIAAGLVQVILEFIQDEQRERGKRVVRDRGENSDGLRADRFEMALAARQDSSPPSLGNLDQLLASKQIESRAQGRTAHLQSFAQLDFAGKIVVPFSLVDRTTKD